MSFYLKDPQWRVDYAVDWSGYLDGQVVAASSWLVRPWRRAGWRWMRTVST